MRCLKAQCSINIEDFRKYEFREVALEKLAVALGEEILKEILPCKIPSELSDNIVTYSYAVDVLTKDELRKFIRIEKELAEYKKVCGGSYQDIIDENLRVEEQEEILRRIS